MRPEGLVDKLWPTRFPSMSDKMVAIVGFLLGEIWTEPKIVDLEVVGGMVMVMHEDDVGYNHFIGGEENLCRNLENLYAAAELSRTEARWMRKSLMGRTGIWSAAVLNYPCPKEHQTRLFEEAISCRR